MMFRTIFLRVKYCISGKISERSFVIENSVLSKQEGEYEYTIYDLRTKERFELLDIKTADDWEGLKSVFRNT